MATREAGLFTLLKTADPEFRRLAQRHSNIDQKMVQYDRIYYLTSEQERKLKELQKQKVALKDEMARIMSEYAEDQGRGGRYRSSTPRVINAALGAAASA